MVVYAGVVRVVEGDGLENRRRDERPGVRIPPPAPYTILCRVPT